MSLLTLLVILIVGGVGLYLVNSLLPMEANVKKIISVLIVVVLAVITVTWMLGFLGVDLGRVGVGPKCIR